MVAKVEDMVECHEGFDTDFWFERGLTASGVSDIALCRCDFSFFFLLMYCSLCLQLVEWKNVSKVSRSW